MFRFSFYGRILSLVFFLISCVGLKAQVIYVDAVANGATDGSSWENAFNSLDNALLSAEATDQIWVAAGLYLPQDSSKGFGLKNEIAIYGGFAGDEDNLEDRDWTNNLSILSGDLLGDDLTDDFVSNKEDNASHVVSANFDIENSAILDGFTIQNGNASSILDGTGGGGLECKGSPIIKNCIFTNNRAINGGGVQIIGNSAANVIFEDCQFIRNFSSVVGGGLELAGLGIQFNISNCIFEENSSGEDGGALSVSNSSPILTGCVFQNNTSVLDGGAIASKGTGFFTSMRYQNCDFLSNSTSTGSGGAVMVGFNVRSGFDNCLFDGNFAEVGGGIASVGDSIGILQSDFVNNMATTGGAINADFTIFYFVDESYFGQNVATDNGGAMALNFTIAELNKCYFEENEADNLGGAIYAEDIETTVINSIFLKNEAMNGAGFYGNANNTAFFLHDLFWKNEAVSYGPTYAGFNSTTVFFGNTISWSNIGPNINQISVGPTSEMLIENSILQGENSPENINQNPMFTDEPNGDFLPLPSSPVVNAGDPNLNKIPVDDYNGTVRDALPDIGPFELIIEPPSAPLNLTAEIQAPFKVILNWEDTNDSEDSYIIERSIVTDDNFIVLNSLPQNATAYEDLSVTPGTTYFYRVRARKLQFFSDYSNTVEIFVPEDFPDGPTNLIPTGSTDNSVFLTWTDNSDDEISFVLERLDPGMTDFVVVTDIIGQNETEYTDTGLEPETLYTYRIKSRSILSDSEYSNTASIATTMISGIDEAIWGTLQVYPNPTTNYLNLVLSNDLNIEQVQVLDTKGQQIKTINVTGNNTVVPVNELMAGAYFIELKTKEHVVHLPFVKE